MKTPTTAELVESLLEIKKSILLSPAVTDTLFMRTGVATVCEEIDGLLAGFGVPEEVLEAHYNGDPDEAAKKRRLEVEARGKTRVELLAYFAALCGPHLDPNLGEESTATLRESYVLSELEGRTGEPDREPKTNPELLARL